MPTSKPDPTTDELDLTHEWTVAAYVNVDQKTAKIADFRGSFRVREDTRIEVMDTLCGLCRRHFEDVADEPCAAKINNEHLRGGPIGERKKRKTFTPPPGATLVPGPRLNRQGVGFLVG